MQNLHVYKNKVNISQPSKSKTLKGQHNPCISDMTHHKLRLFTNLNP
jgi:hypothetical protein